MLLIPEENPEWYRVWNIPRKNGMPGILVNTLEDTNRLGPWVPVKEN